MKQDQVVENKSLDSIDKCLEYLEQNIEEQDDGSKDQQEGVIRYLIDVHGLLTRFKVAQIAKLPVEDDTKTMALYAYMVMSSLSAVLGNWDSKTHIIDGHILLHNDLIYLDINVDDGPIGCTVSLYHKSNPVVVAEVINTLKDIFGTMLKVSSECFVTNDITGDYIWGEKAIDKHLRSINGIKVNPIVIFDDNTVGNC